MHFGSSPLIFDEFLSKIGNLGKLCPLGILDCTLIFRRTPKSYALSSATYRKILIKLSIRRKDCNSKSNTENCACCKVLLLYWENAQKSRVYGLQYYRSTVDPELLVARTVFSICSQWLQKGCKNAVSNWIDWFFGVPDRDRYTIIPYTRQKSERVCDVRIGSYTPVKHKVTYLRVWVSAEFGIFDPKYHFFIT